MLHWKYVIEHTENKIKTKKKYGYMCIIDSRIIEFSGA